MKIGSGKWVRMGLLLAMAFPKVGYADSALLKPAVLQLCETKAQAAYHRKVVEAEMASIVGEASQTELVAKREDLRQHLEIEQAGCRFRTRSRRLQARALANSGAW